MPRGLLRVYLGAAPGVGKTYAMLDEGARRAARGTTVAVAYVETHGRPQTEAALEGVLERGIAVIPRRVTEYRGARLEEMHVDAVIAARPSVALVDELAHTNTPGSRNEKRWQDVAELLDAGITVITTVNIQHLESLGDVVESITGVRQRETIPDAVVRRADQVQLVDMTPEALRRRMAHGNVYHPSKIDAALSNYFRVGNLTALRELALLWLADRVDEKLEQYRVEQGISAIWPARDRTVVALTGGPEGATLLRRAARLAAKGAGGELRALYVTRSDGLSGASPAALTQLRQLTEKLGGTFQIVTGDDVASSILQYAKSINAARIVLGQSRHRPVASILRRSVSDAVIDGSGDIDVQVVTHELAAAHSRRPRLRTASGLAAPDRPIPLGLGRRRAGWALALLGPVILAALLANTRPWHSLPTELMLFLVLTVGVALVGGLRPAVPNAVIGSLLLNYYFTPPLYTLTIGSRENAFALVVFVATGIAVASVVSVAARQTVTAARARSEADVLSGLADTLLTAEDELPALLDEAVATFRLDGASVLVRDEIDDDAWRVVRTAGAAPPADANAATDVVDASPTVALAVSGPALTASDHGLLTAFAAHAAARLDREALREAVGQARQLEEGNRARTALLNAVSHDLRTPLAGIKAAVSSLRSEDVDWSDEDEAELLETIEDSTDRLTGLVGNLLDMSRLQSDSLTLLTREVGIEEVLPAIWAVVPDASLTLAIPDDAPTAMADPGLLERVLANLAENAVRHSPPDSRVTVGVSGLHTEAADRMEIRVMDHGPGVPEAVREQMFAPFQRMGDAPAGSGVGLGLAVARGLTEAMGGTLRAEDTPGGGLTMVVDLPAAHPVPPQEDVE